MSTYRLHRGYAYGYDGNRAIKMTGNATIDQTGTLLNSTNLENITIYPNEYLTVTQAEYTKYYYAGGNRIASKIGTGGFGKMTRLCTQDLNLTANANSLFGNALQLVTSATNQPADEYPADVCGGYSVATELLTNPLPDFYISQTNLNFTQNNLLQQFRQNLAGGTEPVYYFHSDHLGSASWITSGTGLPAQHLLYLPFGEHFVNERSTAYDERFTFTGKERDAETGYYYHGARFNSSDIGWLSVDPMADKYPSLTPYNYCAWNPVKLVDPEGREIVIIGDRGHKYSWDNGTIRYNGKEVPIIGNGFVKETANSLNLINSTPEGKKVLERLSKSNNKYFISREQFGNSPAAFCAEKKKLFMNKHTNFSILSHELFHAFQYDNEIYGRSIYKEVEAYIFQAMVSKSLGMDIKYNNNGMTAFSMLDKDLVAKYNASMERLVNKFNKEDFIFAINNFKNLSNANNTLRYNDYPLRSSIKQLQGSLLMQFYK